MQLRDRRATLRKNLPALRVKQKGLIDRRQWLWLAFHRLGD